MLFASHGAAQCPNGSPIRANLPIAGFAGVRQTKHGDFAMASGDDANRVRQIPD
jgi:hypothetical protein